MAQFGGRKYGLDSWAKGPAYYGLTEAGLRSAWEWYQRGLYVHKITSALRRFGRLRLSLKKPIVAWGAIGLPMHDHGRRTKLRDAPFRIEGFTRPDAMGHDGRSLSRCPIT